MNRPVRTQRVNVRLATADDAAGIAGIYNHHIDRGESTFDTEHWTVPQTAERLSQATLGQRTGEGADRWVDGWYVAVDRGDVLGWASARRYSARFGYRFSCESAIYLDPTAVGQGIGDALQHRIDQHCLEHGIHHAVARIIADNGHSMAFHHRHGYELVGIQKEIGRINDQWIDVALLQKIFAEPG